MGRIATTTGLFLLFGTGLAWAQIDLNRVDWQRSERAADELVKHARLSFLAAGVRQDDASRSLYRVYGDALALRSLLGAAPGTRSQVPEALRHTTRDIQDARAVASSGDGTVREHFSDLVRAFGQLDDIVRRASAPDPSSALGGRLQISNWRGSGTDRYVTVTGVVEGVDLIKADVVVTDRDGNIMWRDHDIVPAIASHYRSNPSDRGRVVRIPFEIELQASGLPRDAHSASVRVFDDHGNHQDFGARLPPR